MNLEIFKQINLPVSDKLSALENLGYAAQGRLIVTGFGSPLDYTYIILENNINGRTIKGFSVDARERMFLCDSCPYEDYQKFIDYYGEFNYADQWITAAGDGVSTEFDNGNADFRKYGQVGKTGTYPVCICVA
jgi:hypothetical protein